MMRHPPAPKQIWRSTKRDHLYQILHIARYHENTHDVVVYRDLETGDVWVRELVHFLGERDNGQYRFTFERNS